MAKSIITILSDDQLMDRRVKDGYLAVIHESSGHTYVACQFDRKDGETQVIMLSEHKARMLAKNIQKLLGGSE